MAAVLGLILLCDCGRPSDRSVVLELVELLPDALVRSETRRIDFGSPDSFSFLIDGWSRPEGLVDDRFVWAVGRRTSIRVYLGMPGSRSFVARCRPFTFPGAPVQTLSVLVGGEKIVSIPLDRGLSDYRWEIPAGVLQEGDNRIDFEYAYAAVPAEVIDKPDHRALAVAWHELRIHDGGPKARMTNPAVEGGALVLPFGQRVEFLVPANGSARIDLGAVKSEAPGASLRVHVVGDRSGLLIDRKINIPDGFQSLPLGFAGRDILRISLLAVPGPGRRPSGGVSVLRPRLYFAPSSRPDITHAASEIEKVERPDVLIYVVDTLRADRLGIYGHSPLLSSRIEEFARDSVVFENARAPSSWTRPAVASILTGLQPLSHGVVMRLDALPEKTQTLAEVLRGAGYATAGIITNGNISRKFGLAQGFDRYIQLPEDLSQYGVHMPATRVTAEAEAIIESRQSDQPFFIYAHVTDPHAPYAPNAEYRSRFAPNVADPKMSEYQFMRGVTDFSTEPTEALRDDLLALYDAEVAFVDWTFGRLLDFLRQRGLYDDMLIVFVADHGEEFLDHGWWAHGKTLYEEQLRVPLIVKFPRGEWAGRRISQPVQQADIVPTILGYLGTSASELYSFDGIDLAHLIGSENIGPRDIVASLDLDERVMEAIVSGRWKLIETIAYAHPRNLRPGTQLFDIDADPGERHNLAAQHPIVVDYLRTRLAARYRKRAQWLEKREAEVDDRTMRNLRALGYFEE